MIAQVDTTTLSQVTPNHKDGEYRRGTVIPFMIDGCTISFTPTCKGADEPMKAVRDILMSSYRTKTARR